MVDLDQHDTHHLLPSCVCGRLGGALGVHLGIPTITCPCGIVRQLVKKTPDELSAWYEREYFAGTYTHSREHDAAVAKLRLAAYRFAPTDRVLDVGCGWGSFVAEGRARGLNLWGQDLAVNEDDHGDHVYHGALRTVAFPTASFSALTCHDVLEHVVDPVAELREYARILSDRGRLLLDFPRFHHEAGQHHWKLIQHLWMFTEDELARLVEAAGFAVKAITHPIPSKVLIEAERLPVKRPRILVPSGIGDAYWCLTKLPGFLRAHGLPEVAEVVVADQGGPRRTQPYLETVPFCHATGYVNAPNDGKWRTTWREAYIENGRTVYPNVLDCDYFLAYNGILRAGRSLNDTDPSFGTTWRFPHHISKAQRAVTDAAVAAGPYVVAYFVSSGMYRHWLREFSREKILSALRLIRQQTGQRIVFLGASWDKDSVGSWLAEQEPNSPTWVNLIGETSYEEMAGLLRGASAVIGWPSGATLIPPAWDVPTVLVWHDYFKAAFWHYSVAPGSPYAAVDARRLTPERLAQVLEEVQRMPRGAVG